MINLEVKNPMRGAAWRVLYERTYPHQCVTREQQAEIKANFDAVLEWAKSQRDDIKDAYEWAAQRILADIDRQLSCIDMNNQVSGCYANIARPPA